MTERKPFSLRIPMWMIYVGFAGLVGWSIYDQHLSSRAAACFAKGGTQYSSWDQGCLKIERLAP